MNAALPDGPVEVGAPPPDRDDVEEVMRLTFERVARNVDRLIERLRDLGHRFECEAGRFDDPLPPQGPVDPGWHEKVESALRAHLKCLPALRDAPLQVPLALVRFSQIVGRVDLRQRWNEPMPPETLKAMQDKNDAAPGIASGAPPPDLELMASAREALADWLDAIPADADTASAAEAEDGRPHPNGDDAVVSRLGDWDPLMVEPEWVLDEIADPDADLSPAPDGGLGFACAVAPSFETKADVSGLDGWSLYLPSARIDPMLYVEGASLTFTDYLRRTLFRGGVFGVPRLVAPYQGPLREVQPGIRLPNHPVFASLAADLEPF